MSMQSIKPIRKGAATSYVRFAAITSSRIVTISYHAVSRVWWGSVACTRQASQLELGSGPTTLRTNTSAAATNHVSLRSAIVITGMVRTFLALRRWLDMY